MGGAISWMISLREKGEVVYIVIAALLGFFVYDAYRINSNYRKTGRIELTTFSFPGLLSHASVYVAAGIVALFVNIDILGSCCSHRVFPEAPMNLSMPMARAFGIGLLGPAGIAAWNNSSNRDASKEATKPRKTKINNISGPSSGFVKGALRALDRIFST